MITPAQKSKLNEILSSLQGRKPTTLPRSILALVNPLIEEAKRGQIESINGVKMIPGEQGRRGDKGDRGDKGEIGIRGEKGDKGDTGEKGEKGDRGLRGVPGLDGADGVDGKDTDDDILIAKVLSKLDIPTADKIVERIVKEKLLRVQNLRDYEQFIFAGKKYKISELMHGGGGLGGATISTGVSGHIEIPKGLINGTNDSFLVASAPQWITINGQTIHDGYGYTLFGLTITMDAPPETGDKLIAFSTGNLEMPQGEVNNVNNVFTVLNTPKWILVNGQTIYENFGYTLSGLTITLDNIPLTGDVIISVLVGNYETPSGAIDGSNAIFTVKNVPKWITVQGKTIYNGSGYTLTGLTITLDDIPETGTIIRSHY